MQAPQAEDRLRPRGGDGRRRPNWWLRLTSHGWAGPRLTLEQREKARRSRLVSWIILGLLVADLVLIPAGLGDMPTLAAIAVFFVGLLIAIIFNRVGFVSAAGGLIVVLICAALMGSIVVSSTGLELLNLPAYDLLAVAVVVGASVLPRAAAFVVALLNVGLIAADYALQPHAANLAQAANDYGPLGLLARPIGLQIIVAVVAYLWVRGTDEAIRRADRAEEIAALEHSIAEQKRQLDIGIQMLLETHVHAANGDFSARAPLRQDNVLWQISYSLNNLLARMQRAVQAEHQLARTQEELRRLATAIDDAQAGRQPLWPAPSGTAADLILERIARGQRRRSAPSATYEQGHNPGYAQTPGGMGWPSLSSQPLDQSPYVPQALQAPPAPQAPEDPYAPPVPDRWRPWEQHDAGQAQPQQNPWLLPSDQPEPPHP